MTKSSKSFLILLAAAALAVLGALTLLTGAARASGGVQAHVVSFDWSPTSGTLTPGESADINVHFDQPVLVTGDPVIFLGVGDDMFADLSHYESGSGTNTLTFRWTPKPDLEGPVSIRGIIDGLWDGNATLTDTEGNPAEMHLTWSGDVYTPTDLVVDTDPADRTSPTVLSVDVPAPGTYRTGDQLNFVVHFSEPVDAHSGGYAPALYLNLPSGWMDATYVSGSGTPDLLLRYTVQAGDHSDGGLGIHHTLGQIDSWVTDLAGNGYGYEPFPSVGDDSGVLIDTSGPTQAPANFSCCGVHNYKVGDRLFFIVNFSELVYVTGLPQILVHLDSGDVYANRGFPFAPPGAAEGSLQFNYTIKPGDLTDGFSFEPEVVLPSGVTIKDADGNDASAAAGAPVTVAGVTITDSFLPNIDSFEVPAAFDGDGDPITYSEGDQLDIVVHFNENVDVTGTPTIALTIGGEARQATYLSGTGTSELTFRYTVAPGDSNIDYHGLGLCCEPIQLIQLNGGTIRDQVGNSIDPDATNEAADDTDIVVDAAAPVVTSFGPPSDGSYKAGDELYFVVRFSEPVGVTGSPTLGLTVGAHSRTVSYLPGYSTDETLVFRYTVQAGDTDANGIQVGALALNGGTIADAAGHASNLDLAGVVPSTVGVKVDTSTPPAPTPTPTPSEPTAPPAPAPAPAAKDTVPPTKPAPAAKVTGGKLQVSSGGSVDNVGVVGYRLYRDGTVIGTFDGSSFKLPVTLNKPGKLVLQLRAYDSAGNLSDPVVITLTRSAHPKPPKVKPAWAWKLARWQDTHKATRGTRPHTPDQLPGWYAKWNAWHKAPVKVTVG